MFTRKIDGTYVLICDYCKQTKIETKGVYTGLALKKESGWETIYYPDGGRSDKCPICIRLEAEWDDE